MSGPDVSQPRVLEGDSYFQLRRVESKGGAPLLAKYAAAEVPGSEEIVIAREFELFGALDAGRALEPMQLDTTGGRLMAFYADCGGTPLGSIHALRAQPLSRLLDAVTGICGALDSVHRSGRVLVAFDLRSFLFEQTTGHTALAAAPLYQWANERLSEDSKQWLPQYLAYAAPEVVGLTEAALSTKVDLYSLGVLLYELFSGSPPFVSSDPGALVQCHLAKQPEPLSNKSTTLPPRACELVMQLLAKEPRGRPESVAVFERLFIDSLDETTRLSVVPQSVPPPADSPREVQLSTRLFGHEAAAMAIVSRFERTRTCPELLLV